MLSLKGGQLQNLRYLRQGKQKLRASFFIMNRTRVIIMGAAGRDFHNFNVFFRDKKEYEVICFTATQIPGIANKLYPEILSGPLYPKGIPIYPQTKLAELIEEKGIEKVVFAYSDVSYDYLMHQASIVLSQGADFWLMGTHSTTLHSKLPIISVGAVRTGSGKSQTAKKIVQILRNLGKKVVAIRHPMPYGDLEKQIVMRFASYEDLDKNNCTIEEREEYEPYIELGAVIYSGVDYQKILDQAEKEAEVIVWDGGNNDFSFYKPDLHIVLTDALRPGHELSYHPGETNLRLADIVIINKVNEAALTDIYQIQENIKSINPNALIIKTASTITVDDPNIISGKQVAVVEDGPTLTHGGMSYGAGYAAAKKFGAKSIISPLQYAVGSIKETFENYPHTKEVLPAMGYNTGQIQELEETLNKMPVSLVIVGTPINLSKILKIKAPSVRVHYELTDVTKPTLEEEITSFIKMTDLSKKGDT